MGRYVVQGLSFSFFRFCFICFNVVSYPNLCFNISLVILRHR